MEFNLTQFWVPPSGVSPWSYQWIPLFNNPTVVDTGIATNASGANRTVDEIVTIHYPATNQDIIAIDDDAGNDDAAADSISQPPKIDLVQQLLSVINTISSMYAMLATVIISAVVTVATTIIHWLTTIYAQMMWIPIPMLSAAPEAPTPMPHVVLRVLGMAKPPQPPAPAPLVKVFHYAFGSMTPPQLPATTPMWKLILYLLELTTPPQPVPSSPFWRNWIYAPQPVANTTMASTIIAATSVVMALAACYGICAVVRRSAPTWLRQAIKPESHQPIDMAASVAKSVLGLVVSPLVYRLGHAITTECHVRSWPLHQVVGMYPPPSQPYQFPEWVWLVLLITLCVADMVVSLLWRHLCRWGKVIALVAKQLPSQVGLVLQMVFVPQLDRLRLDNVLLRCHVSVFTCELGRHSINPQDLSAVAARHLSVVLRSIKETRVRFPRGPVPTIDGIVVDEAFVVSLFELGLPTSSSPTNPLALADTEDVVDDNAVMGSLTH